MVEDDDLGGEVGSFLGGVVLGVGSDVATADILDGDVLDVEADVVTRVALLELFVMHFDGLDFSGHTSGSEGDDHASLDDTSLDTTDGDCANTTDLVHVLERETERLVGGTDWRLNGVDGVEQGLALDDTSLGLLGPALVPCHAIVGRSISPERNARLPYLYALGGVLQHVVTVPARDGDERNRLGVVADLLDEAGSFLDDFVEPSFGPLFTRKMSVEANELQPHAANLGSVHLVDGDDELTDTEGEGEEGVLASLAILGDTSFEFTSTGSNDENGAVSLGGTGNHVLDEITMAGSINDLERGKSTGQGPSRCIAQDSCDDGDSTYSDDVFGGLELPEGNVDGDTTFTLSL